MRVLAPRTWAFLAIGASVLPLTAWTSHAGSPAQPKCSAADTRRTATLLVNGGAHHAPLYLRFCGPARGVIDLNGKSFAIRGGWCHHGRSSFSAELVIAIGLIANRPAAPGRGISLRLPRRPGRTTIDDSEFEVPGMRVAASGIVVLAPGLRGGTFSLYGRTASGPTGVRLSGSWACG
jgi:hypothetical protein